MAAQPPNYGEYGDMMTLRTLGTVLLAAAFLALSACQSGTGVQRSDAPDASFQQRSAPAYVLGNGDRLRVTVFGHPDLSGEFDVDGTGSISLPLVVYIKSVEAGDEQTYTLDTNTAVKPGDTIRIGERIF